MHCRRCYRQLEDGAQACSGCGLSVADPGGTGPAAPLPAHLHPGGPGYIPPGLHPFVYPGPGVGPGLPAPGSGLPAPAAPGGPRSSWSTSKIIVVAAVVSVTLIVAAVTLIGRTSTVTGTGTRPRSNVPSRPTPTVNRRVPTTPTTRQIIPLEELTLEVAQLGTGTSSGPVVPQDPGQHLAPEAALGKVLDPGSITAADKEAVRDAVHRSATDATGTVWDLTVMDLADPAAAAALLAKTQSGDFLGATVTIGVTPDTPAMNAARAHERREPTDDPKVLVETVLLQQRSYLTVASVTVTPGAAVLQGHASNADIAVPLARLQSLFLDCGASSLKGGKPRNC